jgi:hypothetical protein
LSPARSPRGGHRPSRTHRRVPPRAARAAELIHKSRVRVSGATACRSAARTTTQPSRGTRARMGSREIQRLGRFIDFHLCCDLGRFSGSADPGAVGTGHRYHSARPSAWGTIKPSSWPIRTPGTNTSISWSPRAPGDTPGVGPLARIGLGGQSFPRPTVAPFASPLYNGQKRWSAIQLALIRGPRERRSEPCGNKGESS